MPLLFPVATVFHPNSEVCPWRVIGVLAAHRLPVRNGALTLLHHTSKIHHTAEYRNDYGRCAWNLLQLLRFRPVGPVKPVSFERIVEYVVTNMLGVINPDSCCCQD